MTKSIYDSTFNLNKLKILFACVIYLSTIAMYGQRDSSLIVQYTFENLTPDKSQVIDDSGNYNATFYNGATVQKNGSFSVLNLGSSDGYLDLGSEIGKLISSLDNFSISTYAYIDETVNLSLNGNFIWTFANSNDVGSTPNGQMFFSAKTTRYVISQTNWSGETSLDYSKEIIKGEWKHVTYTQFGNIGAIYLDGISVKTGTVAKKPSVLGETSYNYIGRSPYTADVFLLNSLIYDFRIYDRSLSAAEVSELVDNLNELNDALIYDQLMKAKDALLLNNIDEIISDLVLPRTAKNEILIDWTSSNESVITNNGFVKRPSIGEDTVVVTLTATLTKEGRNTVKEFITKVLPLYDNSTSVIRDSILLTLPKSISNLRTDILLPQSGYEGSSITWISDRTDFLTNTGQLIQLSAIGSGRVKVKLTATITKELKSAIKVFDIYIAEDEGHSAYLFAYFTGNNGDEESIRFGLSNDGLNYRALNGNAPIINSSTISSTGGVRDPHILRSVDGNTFYMVATDMVSANGWSSNHGIVLLKSNDLINWTSSKIDIKSKFPEFSTIDRAWAPQSIYDPIEEKYIVYLSLHKPGGKDIIYYSYVNDDFTDLETTPTQLFYAPNNSNCIDADIIYKDDKYYLFHKNETGGGIYVAVSDSLTSGYKLVNKPVDQTTLAVEGSCVYKLINSDTYVLMYDVYASGAYQFTTSPDLMNFTITKDVSMNFHPRHGTVIPITQAEVDTLTKKWGRLSDLLILSSNSSKVKKNNIVISNTNNTIYLPVKNGTDLSSFNPELVTMPGVILAPDTPQNFTKDSVEYTISIQGVGSKIYNVSAKIDYNPLLDGYYADPEVLHSKKTGKYYIYPTSDGFPGWSGTYFKVFSSSNLTDWQDEGVILDLTTDVSWASTNAWAPAILEKKIDGKYKYFYYFCAAQKIGVAVADDPTGPFIDSGQPLISSVPSGANGQQIDPDVFHDSTSGKTYLYWGNGYMARAELNPDMISINNSTIKVITPNSTYREGAEVFSRNGKYYFMWSEDDTRSPNYRVRYATSDSPDGILTIPKKNLVIAKDPSRGIYGTGHNCVLYVPDSSKWYIIYHRFTRPNGINMGDDAGFYREVCIDELQFDNEGNIIQVRPTVEGFGAEHVSLTDIESEMHDSLPKKMGLNTNYPNPFNPATIIKYELPEKRYVSLKVYDLLGKEIITLVDGKKLAGNYSTTFNGSNLSSGIYFYQLSSENFLVTKKMLLLK